MHATIHFIKCPCIEDMVKDAVLALFLYSIRTQLFRLDEVRESTSQVFGLKSGPECVQQFVLLCISLFKTWWKMPFSLSCQK